MENLPVITLDAFFERIFDDTVILHFRVDVRPNRTKMYLWDNWLLVDKA